VSNPDEDLSTVSRVWPSAPGEARWLNPPVATAVTDDGLLVTAAEGSDLWRETSYGFVHDSGHALLAPFPDDTALEVGFLLDYCEQFDQAGVLVRADERTWTKAGVEVSDGEPQVGAVVTRGVSDWSVAPVPEWAGREVTVRASRRGDALTIRARAEDGPWRLVRVAPVDPGAALSAGPFCCAPTRTGLTVRFTRLVSTTADASLHPG
jgi:regulation of enolase protein 1 (concanavalin A-like superfamily)